MEVISLKQICEDLGISPRDARIVLRKADLGFQVEGRRWEFSPSQARTVRSLLTKAFADKEEKPAKKAAATAKKPATKTKAAGSTAKPKKKVAKKAAKKPKSEETPPPEDEESSAPEGTDNKSSFVTRLGLDGDATTEAHL